MRFPIRFDAGISVGDGLDVFQNYAVSVEAYRKLAAGAVSAIPSVGISEGSNLNRARQACSARSCHCGFPE